MQEGFPFKKQITDRGYDFGHPGNGRYIYVLAMTATPRAVLCLDSELLTASNYAGSGVWTVSPIIADITVTANPRALVFMPKTQEVWVVKDSTGGIEKIDANPESTTFNTVVGSLTTNFNTGVHSAAFDVKNNVLFVGRANQIFAVKLDQFLNVISTFFISSPSRCRSMKYDFLTDKMFISDETVGTHINIGSRLNPALSIGFFNQSHNGVAHTDSLYAYQQDNNILRVCNLQTLDVISNVNFVTNDIVRFCRMSTSTRHNRVVCGSYFDNRISFLERSSLTNGGLLSKGATISSENGNISICTTNDIAVVAPRGGACQHVHIFNIENKSWIGYVPLGKNIGVDTVANGGVGDYIGCHVLCKNEADI